MSKAREGLKKEREAMSAEIQSRVIEWARKHAPEAPIGAVFEFADALSNVTSQPMWEAFNAGKNAGSIDATG